MVAPSAFLSLLVASAASVALASQKTWPSSLEFLAKGSDEDYKDFVTPLAQMTKLTYTATWGSYYREKDENETISGWLRGKLQSNPLVGMRALTFFEWNTNRGVMAFRGTDLNSSNPSGQVDACANAFLSLCESHSGQLPAECQNFTVHQLDYLSRALEFAQKAAEAHPNTQWLYTGHSLGALLAELVAAQRSGAPALTFSAPPLTPLLKRLKQPKLRHWGTVTLYDQYDPLRFQAVGQLWSANCTWPRSQAPEGCEACEAAPIDMHSEACQKCFYAAHTFKTYLKNVYSQRRPDCPDSTNIVIV